MTPEFKEEILRLTRNGISQMTIGRTLGLSRGTIHRFQMRSGLCLRRHGPRCPELTPEQKVRALEMLNAGKGTLKTATELGVGEWAVRQIKKANGIHREHGPKLTPEQENKLRDDILARNDYAVNLAAKHDVSYKYALRKCHDLLGVKKLHSGAGRPLDSPFPLRPRTYPFLAEVLASERFQGRASAELICNAVSQVIQLTRDEIDPAITDEAFASAKKCYGDRLLDALRAQINFQTLPSTAPLN